MGKYILYNNQYALWVTQLNTFSKNKYGINMKCNDTWWYTETMYMSGCIDIDI